MYYCTIYLWMSTKELSEQPMIRPINELDIPRKKGVENYSCTNQFYIRIYCATVIDDDDDDYDYDD
jgi:hypothetical protein